MLRNFAYGGLALIGGGITGIAISSWATPLAAPPVAPEISRVVSVAQPAMTLAATSPRTESQATDCSPWDVSDVAMEAALNEMIRRGWRPPTRAEAVGFSGVTPLEPDTSVPVRGGPPAPDDVDTTDVDDPFPVGQIAPVVPSADIMAPTEAPASSLLPPAAVVEEPAPPSN